jgi:hypothetical protein
MNLMRPLILALAIASAFFDVLSQGRISRPLRHKSVVPGNSVELETAPERDVPRSPSPATR